MINLTILKANISAYVSEIPKLQIVKILLLKIRQQSIRNASNVRKGIRKISMETVPKFAPLASVTQPVISALMGSIAKLSIMVRQKSAFAKNHQKKSSIAQFI